MLEKALRGSKGYYAWVGILLLGIVAGVAAYANQLANGLTLTGMSRDVSWGLYIAQFTTPAIVTVCEKILGSVIANVTSYHVAILLSLLFTLWCVLVVDRKPAK